MTRPTPKRIAEIRAKISKWGAPCLEAELLAELDASRAEIRKALAHDDLTLWEFLEEEVRRWTEE